MLHSGGYDSDAYCCCNYFPNCFIADSFGRTLTLNTNRFRPTNRRIQPKAYFFEIIFEVGIGGWIPLLSNSDFTFVIKSSFNI